MVLRDFKWDKILTFKIKENTFLKYAFISLS